MESEPAGVHRKLPHHPGPRPCLPVRRLLATFFRNAASISASTFASSWSDAIRAFVDGVADGPGGVLGVEGIKEAGLKGITIVGRLRYFRTPAKRKRSGSSKAPFFVPMLGFQFFVRRIESSLRCTRPTKTSDRRVLPTGPRWFPFG